MATLKTEDVQNQLRELLDRLLGDDSAEYAEFAAAPEEHLAKSGFDRIDLDDIEACMPDKYDVPAETRARYDDDHPHDPQADPSSAEGGTATWAVVREITMYRECLYPEGDVIVDAGVDRPDDRPEEQPDEDRYVPGDEPDRGDDEAERPRDEVPREQERGEKPTDGDEVVPDPYEQREEAEKLREEAIRKFEEGEELTPEEKALVDEYYDDPVEIDEEPPFTDKEEQAIREALIKEEAGEKLTPDEQELLARYQEAEGESATPPPVEAEGPPPMSPEEQREGREAAAKESRGEELTAEEELLAERYRDYVTDIQETAPVEADGPPPMTPEEQRDGREAAAKESRGEELTKEEELLAERYRDYLTEGQEAAPVEDVEPTGLGPEYDPGVSPELREALAKADKGQELTDDEAEAVKDYYQEQQMAKAAQIEADGGTVDLGPPPESSPDADPTNGDNVDEGPDYGAGEQDADLPVPVVPDPAGTGADGVGFEVGQALDEAVTGEMEEQIPPMIEEVEPVGLTDGPADPPSSMDEEADDAGMVEG